MSGCTVAMIKNSSKLVSTIADEDNNSFILEGTAGSIYDLDATGTLTGLYYATAFGVEPNGADMTSALQKLLSVVYAAGGGTIVFSTGVHTFLGQVILPYNNNASNPIGVPIRWLGAGGSWFSGKSNADPAPGGTIFDCRYSGSDAWLLCLAEGVLFASGITFSQRGSSPVTTPYILTTNTVLQFSECSFEGHSTITAATANQDCIILGGTTTNFGSNAKTNAYQGYGTVIERCNFNRIRRAVYGRMYANGAVVQNNNIWAQCGGSSAIEFDSSFVTINYIVGGLISGNLIECVGYVNPIKLTYVSAMTLMANNFYDAAAPLTTDYINVTNCIDLIVIAGVGNPSVAPYINDPSQCAVYVPTDQNAPVYMYNGFTINENITSVVGNLQIAPNNHALLIQPTKASGAQGAGSGMFSVLRSANEAIDPAANLLTMYYDGSLHWGDTGTMESGQGNITTYLPAATSWSNNGRTWSCNSTGGAMVQNSGTGGSYFNMHNYGVQFFDHAGNYQGSWGAGKMGLSYAPGNSSSAVNDTGLLRSGAGVLSLNDGSATLTNYRDLELRSVIQNPPSSIAPSNNGEFIVEATSNTTLTLKLKGTDGTVRTVALTLS